MPHADASLCELYSYIKDFLSQSKYWAKRRLLIALDADMYVGGCC